MTDTRLVKIKVEKAEYMKGSDWDPYCTFKFLGVVYKTNVIKKSNYPVWNEEFALPGMDIDHSTLNFEIYDKERIGSDKLMAKVDVKLSDLRSSIQTNKKQQTLNLSPQGYLYISYEFDPPYAINIDGILQKQLEKEAKERQQPGLYVPPRIKIPELPILPRVYVPIDYNDIIPSTTGVPLVHGTETKNTISISQLDNQLNFKPLVYYAGTVFKNTVLYTVYNPFVVITRLLIKLKGRVHIKGKEFCTLFSHTINLLEVEEGKFIRLDKGKHLFPFQIMLPIETPSSMTVVDGNQFISVEYSLQVFCETLDQPILKQVQPINIINDYQPLATEDCPVPWIKEYGSLGDKVFSRVQMTKTSFYPGEQVVIDVTVLSNENSSAIKTCDIKMYRHAKLLEKLESSLNSVNNFYNHNYELKPSVKKNSGVPTRNFISFVIPDDILPSVLYPRMVSVTYTIDIPVLNVHNIPIKITFRPRSDEGHLPPFVSASKVISPKREISSIPFNKIGTWSERNVFQFLYYKMESLDAATEFDRLNICGNDLVCMTHDTIKRCLANIDEGMAAQIFDALKTELVNNKK